MTNHNVESHVRYALEQMGIERFLGEVVLPILEDLRDNSPNRFIAITHQAEVENLKRFLEGESS